MWIQVAPEPTPDSRWADVAASAQRNMTTLWTEQEGLAMCDNSTIDPGKTKDDSDAALDAALVAADEDMLATISNGLDLDRGLAHLLKERRKSSAARQGTQAPVPVGKDWRAPSIVISGKDGFRDYRPRC